MPTATIKLFLVHGHPKRLRTADLSNWSGKAVAGPRSDFEDVLCREEAQQSGVYLLTGFDPDTGKPAVYVGEAECLKDRVKAHLSRDFWNQVVFFVSKDENLTKAHVRFLEGELIGQARNAGRAILMNGQSSGARLPESDREDMKVFLEKVNQLLPVLGVDLLVPASELGRGVPDRQQILLCEIKGLVARGYPVPDGFLVLSGSEAVYTERPSVEKWPWPRVMRQKLIDEGILVDREDRYLFSKDTEFSSPSAAAAAIHGGHANGLIAWKTSKGVTLKDMEIS